MEDERGPTRRIEGLVDRTTRAAEEIHRGIAGLPMEIVERTGMLAGTARDVRQIQDVSIGTVYGLVREVNRRVADLAAELLSEPPRRAEPDA